MTENITTLESQWTREQAFRVVEALAPVVDVVGREFDCLEQSFNDEPVGAENFAAWADQELTIFLLDPEHSDEATEGDKISVFVAGIGTDLGRAMMMAAIFSKTSPESIRALGGDHLTDEIIEARIEHAHGHFLAARDITFEIERENRIAQGLSLDDTAE